MAQFGRYLVLSDLGKGISGEVKKATNTETGKTVALKVFRRTMTAVFDAEVMGLIRSGPHPNIVEVFHSESDADFQQDCQPSRKVSYVEMEFCARGELIDFIFTRKWFPEPMAKRCGLEILNGLAQIHGRGLAHRDLKPENILVTEEFEIKIADFGFAKEVGSDGDLLCRSCRGTDGYMSAEIASRSAYNAQRADIFALGVLLFILCAGRMPFRSASSSDFAYKLVARGEWRRFWEVYGRSPGSVKLTQEFMRLVELMICHEPERRLNCQQLLTHPWFTSGVSPAGDFKSWLALSTIPEVVSVAPSENFLSCSRRSVPATHCQTAFLSNLPPDSVYTAIATALTEKGATVTTHPQRFELVASLSDGSGSLSCCLCEEETGVKVEFTRLNGDHFEFYNVVRGLMESLQRK